MTDPYSVLGVSRDASMDDIKKAYRKLSRKYHPDANINNPNKAQAEETFKQVQAAYNQIVAGKERGTSGWSGSSGYSQGASAGQTAYGDAQGNVEFRAAVNYINNGCGTDRQSGTIIMQLPMREWAIISARCRTSSRQWRWIRRTCSTGDCSSSCSSAVSGTRIWDGDMDLVAVRREPGTAAVSAVPVFAV